MDVARGIDVHSHVVPANFPSYLGTHDQTPIARLVDAGFEPSVIEQILHSNAERFLGLVQGSLS